MREVKPAKFFVFNRWTQSESHPLRQRITYFKNVIYVIFVSYRYAGEILDTQSFVGVDVTLRWTPFISRICRAPQT